ncbi:hypothetical protein H6F43_03660 [Leptolyngbya sp. FACHB-36]|uniref:hypothetical protein n=1 Tax=Leptolyngbya sp. FACHB-36 TaxID=2692808 RepID=UPI001681AE95|nr:hypothetical protein [Leptolyngbya sp. FACHB-36]MBD2019278.1 hypothetical protein [Leptolyngbya sp. FACHB-36]
MTCLTDLHHELIPNVLTELEPALRVVRGEAAMSHRDMNLNIAVARGRLAEILNMASDSPTEFDERIIQRTRYAYKMLRSWELASQGEIGLPFSDLEELIDLAIQLLQVM